MLLPSVEGQEGGNWIVIDSGMQSVLLYIIIIIMLEKLRTWSNDLFMVKMSGSLIVHALDEKARAYYNLEQLWTSKESIKEQSQSQSKVNNVYMSI